MLLLDNFCLSLCKGADGRSPLQVLKGANSPRSQRPQVLLTLYFCSELYFHLLRLTFAEMIYHHFADEAEGVHAR